MLASLYKVESRRCPQAKNDRANCGRLRLREFADRWRSEKPLYGKPRRRDVAQDPLDEVRGNGADDIVAHILAFLGDVVPVDFVSGALPHCVALPLGPQQESLLGCDGLLVEPLDRAPCFCMGSIAPRGAAGSRPPITSPASSPPAMARYKGHRANRRFRPLHW